jgi:hypothetical protein
MRISVARGGGQANGANRTASITADGRYVAFDSVASNLVPGDDNGRSDVFVRDLRTATTTLAGISTTGAPGDAESTFTAPSERGEAFQSRAGNLVPGTVSGDVQIYFHTP